MKFNQKYLNNQDFHKILMTQLDYQDILDIFLEIIELLCYYKIYL